MAANPVKDVRNALVDAIGAAGLPASTDPSLERPRKTKMGDYSSNAAMLIAPIAGRPPREIAEAIASSLSAALAGALGTVEVAGPGFLNLSMTDEWHRRAVDSINADGPVFGSGDPATPSILLEFVSANPTGPLTAAGGRGAAYGDSLARILERSGHPVTREYYLNDAGSQIRNFGASIAAAMNNEEAPENGYEGAYIAEIADSLRASGVKSDEIDEVAREGVAQMTDSIRSSLEGFGVRYDTWSSERALVEGGALTETLEELEGSGHTFRSEGALWLRTSEMGDDKDRVLVRSDGEPTYFATDIAYHRDKLARGAELMIDPLGADHHGYVPRMKAAVSILTGDAGRYEAPIMQLVNIVERGERTRMSKRRGDFVTLDDLIGDIGSDAARFFLLQRSHDTVVDLDLELARSESQDNPVYYVQYAHARIAGIVSKSGRSPGSGVGIACDPAERALVRRLLEFPAEIELAAERRAPHRIAAYATTLAADFHSFYRDCRVVEADEIVGIPGLEAARLSVCLAAQTVVGQCLGLLGVSAPERM